MKEKKELAVKSASDVELKVDDGLMDFLPRAESTDFEIPRLVLCQPTSKIEGSPGEIVDGSTMIKVAGLNEKLVFIPVWFFKDFEISEADTQKFRRNEPKTPDNSHYALFDNRIGQDADGVTVQRKERLNLFVILESQLDDDFPRLYRMIIKSSSMKDAKKLLSEWDIQVRSRIAPFSFLWNVSTKMVVGEKSKYAVYQFNKELNQGKQVRVEPRHFDKIKFWVKTLQANQDKVVKVETEVHEKEVSENEIPF